MDQAGNPNQPQCLASGIIGVREIVFQSLASVSPALGVLAAIPMAAKYAGGAVPIAVILACVPCFTVAIAIGELSTHLPSAGSIYTYPARALHPYIGFLVAWGYALAAAVLGPSACLLAASWVSGQITPGQAQVLPTSCAASFLIASVLVLIFGYRGLSLGAKAGTVLGTVEVLFFLALAAALILAAGKNNTLAPFTMSVANVKGYEGMAGIIAAAVFTTSALSGFEASAPLAEEAKDPTVSIRLGALFSCVIVTLVLVATSYGAIVTNGPNNFATFGPSLQNGNPWIPVVERVWGAGSAGVLVITVISAFASQNAIATAASRTWFAMARIGVLPLKLANTHPTWKSPHIAVIAEFVLTLVLGSVAALCFGPLDAAYLLGTVGFSIMFGIYILINISCAMYFWRERRNEFRWLRHGAIPIMGAALLIPILMAATGTGTSALKFVSPLPYPLNLTGTILAVWFGIGLAYLLYLAQQRPKRLQDMTQIFIGE
jgi:amino acid transporter